MPEQIIGKLWEGEAALCYGRIRNLRITAIDVAPNDPCKGFHYADHTCNFSGFGDNCWFWQVTCYSLVHLPKGTGLRMSPQPSLWLTTTDLGWDVVFRLISQIASGRRGICLLELWGKLTFRLNLR